MSEKMTTHQAEEDDRNDHVLIYVDGRIVPRAEAVVSVFDSGFMLGDGVWEGLRLYDGRIAFLDEHLDRLFDAALYVDLDIGLDRTGLTVAVGLALILSLVLIIAGRSIRDWLQEITNLAWPIDLWAALRIPVASLGLLGFFWLLYRFAPPRRFYVGARASF